MWELILQAIINGFLFSIAAMTAVLFICVVFLILVFICSFVANFVRFLRRKDG